MSVIFLLIILTVTMSRSFYSLWFMTYGVLCHFQQYFIYIMAFSFIGGGNRSTGRKPPTCCKLLTNLIT